MPCVNMPELNPRVESMAIRTRHVYLPLTLRNVRNDIGCPAYDGFECSAANILVTA